MPQNYELGIPVRITPENSSYHQVFRPTEAIEDMVRSPDWPYRMEGAGSYSYDGWQYEEPPDPINGASYPNFGVYLDDEFGNPKFPLFEVSQFAVGSLLFYTPLGRIFTILEISLAIVDLILEWSYNIRVADGSSVWDIIGAIDADCSPYPYLETTVTVNNKNSLNLALAQIKDQLNSNESSSLNRWNEKKALLEDTRKLKNLTLNHLSI